ncbi:MAG: hypothetical protein JRC86_04550 [Deltaproteobacteria bacterium]|nr:hypothetical protein [Deltaproteobacteria bacterium]
MFVDIILENGERAILREDSILALEEGFSKGVTIIRTSVATYEVGRSMDDILGMLSIDVDT